MSFSSPLADFMAPTESELKFLHSATRPSIYEPVNISFASPFSDFVAPSRHELSTMVSVDNPMKQSITFATPFSDFSGPRYPLEIIPVASIEDDHSTDITFATPFADAISGRHKPQQFKPTVRYIPALSFTGPESDFCYREEDHLLDYDDVLEASRQISFGTPLADALAPSAIEQNVFIERVDTLISFASPESDVCGFNLTGLQEPHESTQLSFSSPESDFIVGDMNFGMISEVLQMDEDEVFAAIPRTLSAAMAPSHQARVITEMEHPFRIVHVNEAWEGLCGFSKSEAVGNTLKMLQGPLTESVQLAVISNRVKQKIDTSIILTNYSKNGRTFLNNLRMVPIIREDGSGEVSHMLGVLEDVSKSFASSIQ